MCQILSNISVSDIIDLQLYSGSLGLDGMQPGVWRELAHGIVRLPFAVLERLWQMGKVSHCRKKQMFTQLGKRQGGVSPEEDLGVLAERQLTTRQLSPSFKRTF